MTLKEKIGNVLVDKSISENLEKLADNYAIKILEYYHNNLFFIPLKKGEAKKILTYIKKEKNL
jgi:hypothetical protein